MLECRSVRDPQILHIKASIIQGKTHINFPFITTLLTPSFTVVVIIVIITPFTTRLPGSVAQPYVNVLAITRLQLHHTRWDP